MTFFTARALLLNVARLYEQQRESFSRKEIVAKLNEIKYLSSHKKVPKLTLRREVIHLEHKLERLFELEARLKKQKKEESAKVIALKKEIVYLKKRLVVAQDREMHKKIEKLSHLLGDLIAKRDAARGVTMEKHNVSPPIALRRSLIERTRALLEQKVTILKQELEQKKKEGVDPTVLGKIEEQLMLLEQRLHPAASPDDDKTIVSLEQLPIKHTLLFDTLPKETEMDVEKQLPLPPPPKVERKE